MDHEILRPSFKPVKDIEPFECFIFPSFTNFAKASFKDFDCIVSFTFITSMGFTSLLDFEQVTITEYSYFAINCQFILHCSTFLFNLFGN